MMDYSKCPAKQDGATIDSILASKVCKKCPQRTRWWTFFRWDIVWKISIGIVIILSLTVLFALLVKLLIAN